YLVQKMSSETSAERYRATLGSVGDWADINYKNWQRGAWPSRKHLKRLQTMAATYADSRSTCYKNPAMKTAILSGLNHWIEKDYQNENWWYGRIGTPLALERTFILLGDDLPDQLLQDAKTILDRGAMGMTGQNKVWCAGIAWMKGLLYDDQKLMDKAVEAIWSELRVSTYEGIQPDWSFHQHGPQQQFGNYGNSFGGDMIQWATILRGTDYALADEKLEILRNYILNGVSWIVWNGRMDFSGCGRQVDKGAQQKKGRAILRQLDGMKSIDPACGEAYDLRLDSLSQQEKKTENRLTGFKPFWRSEMGVQRRPEWYASVKMSSTRVIGAETCNSENMLGKHLGDGVLFVFQSGAEYEDMVPVWDWKRLPGTTCDQGLVELQPADGLGDFGGSDFSGVLGDGKTGLAAMICKREDLTARKSWFFLEDEIVCLGAGISGNTKGPVYTSIQQSWLKGAVEQGRGWAHHDGIGYQFLEGKPEVKSETIEGNWNGSFPTRGNRPASGDVFSIWIDHGVSPTNETYAYRILPQVSAEKVEAIQSGERSRLVINSETVQAVEKDEKIYAVFYEAGILNASKDRVIETDGPCLLALSGTDLAVSDPTHRIKILEIKLNGKKHKVELPAGAERGKQVVVK
ncbi:MAG: polysaccharide lyase beta-sandwich domain-containing protein, partial [Kiritimatiellaceae bacterium]|nr:polysaccharide lyase beta-sandwich domain-containing protein [Kiritimatiellaceae bacterium]